MQRGLSALPISLHHQSSHVCQYCVSSNSFLVNSQVVFSFHGGYSLPDLMEYIALLWINIQPKTQDDPFADFWNSFSLIASSSLELYTMITFLTPVIVYVCPQKRLNHSISFIKFKLQFIYVCTVPLDPSLDLAQSFEVNVSLVTLNLLKLFSLEAETGEPFLSTTLSCTHISLPHLTPGPKEVKYSH